MFRRFTKINLITENILKTAFIAALFLILPAIGFAQSNENSRNGDNQQATANNQTTVAQANEQKSTAAVLVPVLKNYKEVVIGMPANDVRDKLGKPELDDQKSYFYRFSDDESAQVLFDGDKKVRIISMMYQDKNGTAPKPADVFGDSVEIAPNQDGTIYKIVRYPEAGYVVVYSRSTGDNPMVIVTMQKI